MSRILAGILYIGTPLFGLYAFPGETILALVLFALLMTFIGWNEENKKKEL